MKHKLAIIVLLLSASLVLYSLHLPLVRASAGSHSWGARYTIKEYISVGQNDEIPKNNYGYVFNIQQTNEKLIGRSTWEDLVVKGDFSSLATQIEQSIPGAKPIWISVSWDRADPIVLLNVVTGYIVSGFRVEALVQNVNAGLTGLEIVAIIIACAFLVTVCTLLGLGVWVVWNVLNAANALGPWVTIIIGLIIFVIIVWLLASVLGIKFKFKGKGRQVSTERAK